MEAPRARAGRVLRKTRGEKVRGSTESRPTDYGSAARGKEKARRSPAPGFSKFVLKTRYYLM
jgi:hypothetical protein